MFKYVLFDLDGTLTDPKEGICKSVQYALKKAGIDEPNLDKLEPFIGPPLIDSFKEFYKMNDEDASLAVVNYRERFSSIGLYENELYPRMDEMLANLKSKGIRLAVASSKPEVFVKKILKYFKIKRFFDVVVGSELDGRRSNKSEVVSEALRQLYGLKEGSDVNAYLNENEETRKSTAMVGDRKFDIKGAKDFNITAVGVRFGYAEKNELEKAGADYIANTVEQLGDFIIIGTATKSKKKSDLNDSKSSFFKAVNVIIPLIWYYFVMMLVTFVGLLITNAIKRGSDYDKVMWISNNSVLLSCIIQLVGLATTIIVFACLFRKSDPIKFKYKNDILLYVLAGIALSVSLNVILPSLTNWLQLDILKYEQSETLKEAPVLLGLITFAVLSPIVEELLFRWLMYGRMKRMLNVRVSIFVSSLFFGFYHGNLLQGIYAFVMGMIMAMLYEWSGTIVASMAFHLSANIFVYMIKYMPVSIQNMLGYMPISIVLLLIGTALVFYSYLRKGVWEK